MLLLYMHLQVDKAAGAEVTRGAGELVAVVPEQRIRNGLRCS